MPNMVGCVLNKFLSVDQIHVQVPTIMRSMPCLRQECSLSQGSHCSNAPNKWYIALGSPHTLGRFLFLLLLLLILVRAHKCAMEPVSIDEVVAIVVPVGCVMDGMVASTHDRLQPAAAVTLTWQTIWPDQRWTPALATPEAAATALLWLVAPTASQEGASNSC